MTTLDQDVVPTPETESFALRCFGYACGVIFLSLFLYLLVCVVSFAALEFIVDVNAEDLDNTSWLVPQALLTFHGRVLVGLIAIVATANAFLGRVGFAGILAFFALVVAFATAEVGMLRLGILNGDAKLGCYTYESLECHTMLNVPSDGTKSIYVPDRDNAQWEDRFADWYQPIRHKHQAALESSVASTIPGIALLKSPFTLTRIQELRHLIDEQRGEMADFKATFAK